MKRLVLPLALTLLIGACASGTADTVPPVVPDTNVTNERPDVTEVPDGGSSTVTDPPGVPRADPVQPPVEKGPFNVDRVDIMVMESFPIQVAVEIYGTIPTPCDMTGWKVDLVGDEIFIDVFSIPLNDPAASCVAVTEDVDVRVPLGSFESGSYTVYVNGDEYGDFEA